MLDTRVYSQRMEHLSFTRTPGWRHLSLSLYQHEIDHQFIYMYATLQQIMQVTAIPIDGLSTCCIWQVR